MAYILPPPPFDIDNKIALQQWLYELYKRNLTILDDVTTSDELADFTITSIADGELLRWNGTVWINNTLTEAGIYVLGAAGFLSSGIDDDAPGIRFKVEDTAIRFGVAGANYDFSHIADDRILGLWGGTTGNGGNLLLAGSSHATNAGDMHLRSDLNPFVIWDESTGIFTASTGSGSKTLALTITAAQSVQPVSFKLPLETTTNLEDVNHAINTGAAKVQGTVIYNSTTDNPVYAVANADNSVWVGADGSTLHTPV